MTIRPFDPARDYPEIVAHFNANYPSFCETEDEFRYGDNYRDPAHHFSRVVAERDGVVLGYGQSSQDTHAFHPQKFTIDVVVDPAHQGTGIGKSLYSHVTDDLAPRHPIALRAHSVENHLRGTRFLTDRGYRVEMRYSESWLDVNAFDPTPFAGAEERVQEQGITLTTFAALGESDPELRHRLFLLSDAIREDIPSPEPRQPIAYEVWAKRFSHAGYLPQAQFLARDGDELVGLSALWGRQGDNHLQTGTTGVLRSHRRRGIALALKLRAIAFARQYGAPIIRTDNESNNEGMLSINRALGFVPQPGWVGYIKDLPGG